MPKLGCINAVKPYRLSPGIEPVRNVLNSLWLIADCHEYPGVSPFITRTHAALADEVKMLNRVFMIGLQYAAFPVNNVLSFENYLQDLQHTDPKILQQQVFHAYDLMSAYKVNIISKDSPVTVTKKDQERLLSSKKNYLEYLTKSFGNETLDYDIEGRAYDFLVEPEMMRDTMVAHFQYMWTYYLKEEFVRNHVALEKAVAEFRSVDVASMDPFEAAGKITGHDIRQEWADRPWELQWIETSNRVVFVPSFHMGPYLGRRVLPTAMYIFFSPKIAEGLPLPSPDLTRADINTRLSTLSDDIRLRIIKMLTRQTELSSKQIMEDLGLTQSSASRHLKQLSATGFINERRRNSAKIYSLNRSFVSQTMDAVTNYLLDA
jgi:DNA-binding transcriptional ArsR family regulator